LLQQAELLLTQNRYNISKVRILIFKAQLFNDIAQYPEALKNLLEAKKILESQSRPQQDTLIAGYYFKIVSDIGLLFYSTGKFDDAKVYFQKGLDYLNKIGADPSMDFYRNHLLRLNVNFGAVYTKERNFDRAEFFFTKALQYLDEKEFHFTATLLNNLSIIAREKGELDKAFDLVNQARKIWEEHDNKRGLAQSLNNLGNCYFDKKDIDNAFLSYQKAFEISNEYGFGASAIISLEQLAAIHAQKGEFKMAHETYKKFKIWSDSLLNLEKIRLITQLELQDKFEKRLLEWRIEKEKNEAEQKRRELIYSLIIILASMGLIILVLLYFLQKNKAGRLRLETEKSKLEQKGLELEKHKLEEDLEFKNKELATNVMYMVRKNELINNVSEKLIKSKLAFKKENQTIIEEIIRDLQSTTEDDVWTEFEIRFQQVHNDFYNKLNEKVPNLTANEKKLCAFLRLNMSTKEISAITYQSVNSITVARSRLRKKIGLETDESLISFLESI
jgi:tetratricopeptide (TPR) repeat protein